MASEKDGETAPAAEVPAYDDVMAGFRAEDLAALLSGDPATGLNVCVECCDRHADGDRVALYWEGVDGDSSVHTFAELRNDAARFANFLEARGMSTRRCSPPSDPRPSNTASNAAPPS
jgi:acetyl-CoA synthetase